MSNSNFTVEYNKKELPASLNKIGFLLFGLGLVLVILAFFVDSVRSAFNSVIFLTFVTSIGLGSLFWIAVEYLSGAVWSTPFRRVAEFFGALLFILPILALPAYFNMHEIYHWTHTAVVEGDEFLKAKSSYLDVSFFAIRNIVFFLIWIVFFFFIARNSLKQDENGDQSYTKKNLRWSAIFIPFFAITVSFFSIDWLMSLEPHWFSTIFGVYYFAGTVLAALAAITYTAIKLNERGYFVKGLNQDHYYSFGALLFGFVNFWAYIAFSQYLLIWYGNLPEETFWFLEKWEGNWIIYSILLIIIHFVIPYFALLSQPSKMNPKRLKFMALWILVAHYFDLLWIVMPTYEEGTYIPGWIELSFPILAVGLIILVFNWRAKNKNFVPIGDPKLKRGINFRL